MPWRSVVSSGFTSALRAISAILNRNGLISRQRQRCACIFIWFAATRPFARSPVPVAPPVSANHGRCAGAFACVRIHAFSLAVSVLSRSNCSAALSPEACLVATLIGLLLGVKTVLSLQANIVCPKSLQTGVIWVNSARGNQEILDRASENVGLLHVGDVPGALDLDEARARNAGV